MSRRKSYRRNVRRRGGRSVSRQGAQLDPFQRAAHAEGYRARSAYKLKQMNERFHILKPGQVVLDLGAAPGGWSQVAAIYVRSRDPADEFDDADPGPGGPGIPGIPGSPDASICDDGNMNRDTGTEPSSDKPVAIATQLPPVGMVVGIDLVDIEPWPGCHFIQGDLTEDETLDELSALCPKGSVDVVISDMSPKLSGNYDMDQARSVHLSLTAHDIACEWLHRGGAFVVKVFEGADFQDFRARIRERFRQVRSFSPSASRKASSEIYLIAKGFKG